MYGVPPTVWWFVSWHRLLSSTSVEIRYQKLLWKTDKSNRFLPSFSSDRLDSIEESRKRPSGISEFVSRIIGEIRRRSHLSRLWRHRHLPVDFLCASINELIRCLSSWSQSEKLLIPFARSKSSKAWAKIVSSFIHSFRTVRLRVRKSAQTLSFLTYSLSRLICSALTIRIPIPSFIRNCGNVTNYGCLKKSSFRSFLKVRWSDAIGDRRQFESSLCD